VLTSTVTLSATEAASLTGAGETTLDALSALEPSVAAARVAPQAATGGAEAAVGDLTGDDVAELILAESDGRLLVAAFAEGAWALHEMPVLPAGISLAGRAMPRETRGAEASAQWHLGETVDVDGDGVDELRAWRETPIAAKELALLRWDGTAFRDLLALPSVSQSADPWEGIVTRSSGGASLRIACSPLLPFGSLGGPAEIVTRTYTWNDLDGELEVSDVQSRAAAGDAAPATLNDAETALRAGDLDTAEALFQEVAAAPVEGPEPGLARLRLGLTYALAGRAAQARIAAANALDAPNGIAEVADAFLRGYDTSDAARGLATARESAAALSQPLDARDVLWGGHEIAAWIAGNSVADLVNVPESDLGAEMDATVVAAAVADLDGDGTDEAALLVSTELSGQPVLWLVDPAPAGSSSTGVLVLPVAEGAESLALSDVNGEPALEVTYAGRDLLVTWDGAHAAIRAAESPAQILGYAAGTDPRPGHEPCADQTDT
jgi:hypothetical protein